MVSPTLFYSRYHVGNLARTSPSTRGRRSVFALTSIIATYTPRRGRTDSLTSRLDGRRQPVSPDTTTSYQTIAQKSPVAISTSSATSDKRHGLEPRPPSYSSEPSKSGISSTRITSPLLDVNPPPSTRPAALQIPGALPPSATIGEKLSRYIAVGRAYFFFYKIGLKNVYHNYCAALPLRRSLGLPAYLPTLPPPPARSSAVGTDSSFHTAIMALNLSRADFQLIRRAADDVWRIVPFMFVLVVCEEFTPLVILALGNAVTPSTCRIPKQLSKDRVRRAERKRAVFASIQAAVRSATPISPGSEEELEWLAGKFADLNFAATASAQQVLQACTIFNLARTHKGPSFMVPPIYRPRLKRWVEYLDLDDRLIVRGHGVKALNAAEVRIAVEDRGGVGVATGEEGWQVERQERRWLERWLKRRKLI